MVVCQTNESDQKKQYSISLAVHMAISDGMNIMTVLAEIINVINALETNTECDEMRVRLDPPESSHSMCEKTGLFRDDYLKKIKELNETPVPKFVFDSKFKSENETGFALDLFCIDQSASDKIIKLTKKNGLRVTSYFQTVAFYALKKLYAEYKIPLQESLPISPMITLRTRFNPVYEFYNCRYYTVYFTIATRDESSFEKLDEFWRVAKSMHDRIYSYLKPNDGYIFAASHNQSLNDKLNK